MSSDPNKKSPRTFQCRDVLWETFEQMARELECSVDYLVNEAMKQYARQRSYGGRETGGAPAGRGSFPPPPPPARSSTGLPAPPARGGGLPPPPARGGLPAPPPGRGAPTASGLGMPPPSRAGGVRPPPQRGAPPPVPGGRASLPPMSNPMSGSSGGYSNGHAQPQSASLSIIYQGDKFGVNKDRFVIGRGKQSSDLTLKDPNVSRQHAMIEYQNGVYFMVDMGSTNGVEYNGQRIARKQIAEGDVFRICDHDLRFTYR